MSLEEYKLSNGYNIQTEETIDEDNIAVKDVQEVLNLSLNSQLQGVSLYSSSVSDKYYYNTGTSCPSKVDYKGTRILSLATAGDLVYEAAGGFGLTGHVAVVEGKYWDPNKKRYYIRLIEAIDKGVTRGIWDATRLKERYGYLLKFKEGSGVNYDVKNKAVEFCKKQLGKKYGFGSGDDDWYCSQLAWTAYHNQGVTVGRKNEGVAPITPLEIFNAKETVNIQPLFK